MSKQTYQRLLDEAMGINTEIARLPTISEDIMMISYNAEAAAARAGDHGRSLHVLTAEIHQLADIVSSCVNAMTNEVMRYTRGMATVSNNHNRQQFYARASNSARQQKGTIAANVMLLEKAGESLQETNGKLLHAIPQFLEALHKNVEEIKYRIRLGEVISTNVSIEVASMMAGMQEVKVFKLLAEKLMQSCIEMRRIIGLCEKRLVTIQKLSSTEAKPL